MTIINIENKEDCYKMHSLEGGQLSIVTIPKKDIKPSVEAEIQKILKDFECFELPDNWLKSVI